MMGICWTLMGEAALALLKVDILELVEAPLLLMFD
jgi:hypothetical protein